MCRLLTRAVMILSKISVTHIACQLKHGWQTAAEPKYRQDDEESDAPPRHNHKRALRHQRPVVQSTEQLAACAYGFGLPIAYRTIRILSEKIRLAGGGPWTLRQTGRRDRNGPDLHPRHQYQRLFALAHKLGHVGCWFAHNRFLEPVEATARHAQACARESGSGRTATIGTSRHFRTRIVKMRDVRPIHAVLFDIVNVRNWPAAPRSVRSGRLCSRPLRTRSAAAGYFRDRESG